ncbi:MAG: SRPBCC family protein [Solirubrobacterales bacterium]
MKGIEVKREINAPAERVWGAITDLDGATERLSGVDAIERLGGPEFGVGTRWRETRTMFGKQATEDMEIATVDDGRAYTVIADSHSTHYHSEMRVESAGDAASVLSMRMSGEPQTFWAKLAGATIGRLFVGATRKALQKDLDEIAAAAEATPDDSQPSSG